MNPHVAQVIQDIIQKQDLLSLEPKIIWPSSVQIENRQNVFSQQPNLDSQVGFLLGQKQLREDHFESQQIEGQDSSYKSSQIQGLQNHNNEGQKDAVNVLSMIQVSHPIQKKSLKPDSLEHDIKLGWIPKTQITGPIPLSFNHQLFDQMIKLKLLQKKAIYLGYRPTNTFDIHKRFYEQGKKYPFYQFHLCKSQFLERFFLKYYSNFEFTSTRKVGMLEQQVSFQQNIPVPDLQFNSEYEGGNLDFVYFEESEHRLIIRVDSNTKGHCNYYNFKIKCNKSGKYKFRIMNISKRNSLYERGMKPYIRNVSLKTKAGDEWRQGQQPQCKNVKFGPSLFNQIQGYQGRFYCLRFQLQLKSKNQYQICYSIPYVYSQLVQMINKIRQNKNLHVGKLCYSLSGVQIPLLTISWNQEKKDLGQDEKQQNDNYFVVITGRIHPAQSNGSHIVNGIIMHLLKDQPQVKSLRKNLVFKIIPMLNPDGVIIGNTRTGFAGKDLNRKFSDRNEFIFPQVNSIRDYVLKLKQKHGTRLLFVIDIHGHSVRKGSFFFGPQYPVFNQEYTKCRLLPKLYSNRSEAFRYYSCKFKISECKNATSRGFFNANGIRTYTHQTSMHSYYDFEQRRDSPFTRITLENLGKDLVMTIYDYVQKLNIFASRSKRTNSLSQIKSQVQTQNLPQKQIKAKIETQIYNEKQQQDRQSDNMASDKADSQSDNDDIDDKVLNVFYQTINENKQYFYEQILKSLKNKRGNLSNSPTKERTFKVNQFEKERIQKQKLKDRILQKQQQRKRHKINLAAKASYTPKKTLFQEYQKLSNVVLGKDACYKGTSSIIPKIRGKNMTQASSKRYSLQTNVDSPLSSFRRIKLQNYSNRIVYTVPHVKQSSGQVNPKGPRYELDKIYSSQIYKMDRNYKSQLQNDEIIQRKLTKKQQSPTNQYIGQKQQKTLKINRNLLEKLLAPSTGHIIGEKYQSNHHFSNLKDYRKKSTLIDNTNPVPLSDYKRTTPFSVMIKRDQTLNTQVQKPQNSPMKKGPQIQTEKEDFLCKKWQKQIVMKIKKKNSFGVTVLSSDSKLLRLNDANKRYLKQSHKTLEKQQDKQRINMQKGSKKQQNLPNIYLNRKQVIIIRRTLQND